MAVNDPRRDRWAAHLPARQPAPARVVARFSDCGYRPVVAVNPLSAAQDAVTLDDRGHLVLVLGTGV